MCIRDRYQRRVRGSNLNLIPMSKNAASTCCVIFFGLLGIAATLYYYWSTFFTPLGCGDWTPIDVRSIPEQQYDDVIQVSYLVAPLMECEFGDKLGELNAFHGALGFTNLRTKISWTMNFEATPSFLGALVPTLNISSDDQEQLIWQNYGAVFIYEGVNASFWTKFNKVVAYMSGEQFEKYKKWIVNYNQTVQYYDLWNVFSDYPNGTQFVNAVDCFEFVWRSLQYLKSIGSKVTVKSLKQCSISLLAKEKPSMLNENDPLVKSKVSGFYAKLSKEIQHKSLAALLDVINAVVLENQFIIRLQKNYYLVSLHKPWVSFIWDDKPLF
eukprot:TRINITY_DN2667_c0_g1_i1.p1 TRINITY_DN2667_c0_g1~~TRINITY_DN2667_c0_g1_i1.p1  ORF type:complete len:326 (-),score=47.80 TRINITY_DN2667_c0_g1_i1:32-1009(-)